MAKDVLKELEELHKSDDDQLGEDGIAALEKALAEFEDFEELGKSEDDDGEGEGDEDGDDGDDGDKGKEPVEKSEDDLDLEAELIKASEAYADLESSVESLRKSTEAEMTDIKGALAGVTELIQAVGKGVVALNKSLKTWGNAPGKSSRAVLGDGRQTATEGLQKSKSEVTALVKAAVEEGTLAPIWLSKVSVHGEGVLTPEIKAQIGL